MDSLLFMNWRFFMEYLILNQTECAFVCFVLLLSYCVISMYIVMYSMPILCLMRYFICVDEVQELLCFVFCCGSLCSTFMNCFS